MKPKIGQYQTNCSVAQTTIVPELLIGQSKKASSSILSNYRDLSNHHIENHNSPESIDSAIEEEFTCKVCYKVLRSASSLERHILVHSDELPFKCNPCDMAFTSNGNMNRHSKIAHNRLSSHSCSDSEASNDSESPTKKIEEYNNNEIAKRNSPDLINENESLNLLKRKSLDYTEDLSPQKKFKNNLTESQINYTCPICGKQDFASSSLLEIHLEHHHLEIDKCESDNLSYKCHRVLNLHRSVNNINENSYRNATRNLRHSVEGFGDLTFVDFTSTKYPMIARAKCEEFLHRPASGEMAKFQCAKCLRAFPCKSALDSHEMDCGIPNVHWKGNDSQSRRDDFFAGLNLQNKAAMTEAKDGKDLADIQSIISITSSPILHSFSRSDASTPDNCSNKINQNVGSSGSSGTVSSECNEEETQDAFAAEFRKMKLKGEFPCKLCDAVFPNLRALKGHNRAHMGVPPGMPYPCNICNYTSTDKTTLTRHLKTHNGDRPFECAQCTYAFTTKANCERHVRNRHGVHDKNEVQKTIIYHPTEDLTNEGLDRSLPRPVKDEVRKTLVFPKEENYHNSYTVMHMHQDIKVKDEKKPEPSINPASQLNPLNHLNHISQLSQINHMNMQANHYEQSEVFPRPRSVQPLELTYRSSPQHPIVKSEYPRLEEDLESRSSEGSVSLVSETKPDTHQRIQANPMNLKKSSDSSSDDGPLDLSMDVLDLSKKSKDKEVNGKSEDHVEDQKDFYNSANPLLLTQALLKARQVNSPPTSLEALYANAHANMIYNNLALSSGTGLISPYFLNSIFEQGYAMKERLQKELARGLQTSGGSLVEQPSESAAFNNNYPPSGRTPQPREEQIPYPSLIPPNVSSRVVSPRERISESPSSNSVKMVIKNGVLMRKQKQRRYRTERPFTCEYCSAKFTLKTNMERHIKQQHNELWHRRPRGGHSTRGRPPARPPTLLQNVGSNSPSFIRSKSSNSSYEPPVQKEEDFARHPISDQVKYAILAQQLKGNKGDEAQDSDEELVIDEEASEHSKSISLLRKNLEHSEKEWKEEEKEERKEEEVPEAKIDNGDKEEEKEEDDKEEETEKETEERGKTEEEAVDLASVPKLIQTASQKYPQFKSQYLSDEDGVAHSNSEHSGNHSGSTDEKSENSLTSLKKKKKKKKMKASAYSMAPNRVICKYCHREFPWISSLRRHILTHTGVKPYRCDYCMLDFTTKSNCDRHLNRKHKSLLQRSNARNIRNSSSPDNHDSRVTNNNSFSTRNVPERPYKCNQCPSSTFATLGNLKKHRSTKHSRKMNSRSETSSSDPQHSDHCQKQNDHSGDDGGSSSSENVETSSPMELHKANQNTSSSTNETARSCRTSPTSSPGPTDTPFKCHIPNCDNGFAERQDCLDHIRMHHEREYEILVSKGALQMGITSTEEQQPPPNQHSSDGPRSLDYKDRKVVCAFCMRRFWSAEDLRRHVRTHTGEKPFWCDICDRRFTLKHSMLRHRKKHESVDSTMYIGSGDEEISPNQPPTITPRSQQQSPASIAVTTGNSMIAERMSLPTVATIATGDAAPSSLTRFNPYEKLATLTSKLSNAQSNHDATETGNDLISNLLGIKDPGIVDKMLLATPDDAAKLLGVKGNSE
ncbi:ras-responsive element-binding protein 1 isoform X2 [Leptopilina heterotoma]|uniref:ras-responsive element-binding protein 1 isoform X2 n=1 Tax=Leptopilina heterotoma TaxID=63436 RepID=UPI001CA8CAAC|nr:ras-responsive element-binding protein 1 isoform X2 [Leptopilina heterotoma]